MVADKQQSKKAAIYIRVSSNEQAKEGFSPKTQEDRCRQHAEINNYSVDKNHIYIDLGHSGSTENRPELQRLLVGASNKEFDVIFVTRQDRFFRNLLLLLQTVNKLRNYGVGFKSTEEGFDTTTPAGRAMFANAGAFAEWQREVGLIARDEGVVRSAKEGRYACGGIAPYGYRYNKENKKLEIDGDEVRVVRMFFDWLVNEKLSLYKIQQRVNVMGTIPTKHDRLGIKNKKRINPPNWWKKRTIGRILTDEIYTGGFHARKYKNPSRSRLNPNNLRPKEDWLFIQAPAIISKELFDNAQKQLMKNSEFSPRNAHHTYALAKLIRCGDCGRKFVSSTNATGVRVYACAGRRKYITANLCRVKHFAESRILPPVWEKFVELFTDPEASLKSLEQFQKSKNNLKELNKKKDIAEAIGRDLRRENRRLMELYKHFEDVVEQRKEILKDLEKNNKKQIENQKEIAMLSQFLLDKDEQTKRLNSIKRIYKKIKNSIVNADYDTKTAILQRLIGGIIVKGDNLEVEFLLPDLFIKTNFQLRDKPRMDRAL